MDMINLLHGDCLELMKGIPDNSIDMVLTDPPYGTTACKWDTVIPFEPMWEQLKRITKDNGAICLFGSEPFSSNLRMSNIKMFKYDWIWEKDKGSNIGLSRKQPLRKSELISVFYKKQPRYDYKGEKLEKEIRRVLPNRTSETASLSNAASMLGEARKYVTYTHKTKTNMLYFVRESQYGKSLHPTQKPVPLLEYLIKTYTLENETVLDFTMGSGSTGVACKNLNRKFIGIEKDDKYFEIARERIIE
jgi:site-specific DNA-methyltransferase (adenine-specific)